MILRSAMCSGAFFEGDDNDFRISAQPQGKAVPDPGSIGNVQFHVIDIAGAGNQISVEKRNKKIQSPDHAAVSVTGEL